MALASPSPPLSCCCAGGIVSLALTARARSGGFHALVTSYCAASAGLLRGAERLCLRSACIAWVGWPFSISATGDRWSCCSTAAWPLEIEPQIIVPSRLAARGGSGRLAGAP